ncbi:hypothetical protein KEM54_006871 [Ascosphaera aggregata]|nr:hypothetical protein KEM54_006871 [Ascosphaera aggregata]
MGERFVIKKKGRKKEGQNAKKTHVGQVKVLQRTQRNRRWMLCRWAINGDQPCQNLFPQGTDDVRKNLILSCQEGDPDSDDGALMKLGDGADLRVLPAALLLPLAVCLRANLA